MLVVHVVPNIEKSNAFKFSIVHMEKKSCNKCRKFNLVTIIGVLCNSLQNKRLLLCTGSIGRKVSVLPKTVLCFAKLAICWTHFNSYVALSA